MEVKDVQTAQPLGLSAADFAALQEAIPLKGPVFAAEWLCEKLEAAQDFGNLFYALLMKARLKLGVSPYPAGPASTLPEHAHEAYEAAIRDAGRHVGGRFLQARDFGRAWSYFSMLGETQSVIDALRDYQPAAEEEVQPIIDVCLYQGALPEKGFDLVVERYGICNAITTFGNYDFSKCPAAKQHAIRTLVSSLYRQLQERMIDDLRTRGQTPDAQASVKQLLAAHTLAFDEQSYHVDTSHLMSIVQYSLELEPCAELQHASELAAYGSRLNETFQPNADAPFEQGYADYRIALDLLRGVETEAGLAHFQAKIEQEYAEGNTLPAEIFVNLCLRLGRHGDALATAQKYLADVQRPMACPGVYEICLKQQNHLALADAARLRGDGVSFVAALAASLDPKRS
jgi:hypothetical protein